MRQRRGSTRAWLRAAHVRSGGLLLSIALLATGCAIHTFAERSSAPSAGGGTELLTDPLAARRLQNLETHLHPVPHELVHAHGAEWVWARDAMVVLPSASCARAVGYTSARPLACSLTALGEGRVAVLVMSDRHACDEEESCLEQSWVFVPGQRDALPLPPRRLSDYRSLRSVVSREHASALWLAGFRSYGDARYATLEGEEEPPRLADYATCTPSPDGRELVCRSTRGDVVAIDPLIGASRLVATLGIDLGELPTHALRPVWWTADGRLAVSVSAVHHPLCGSDACELVGVVDWQRHAPARARLMRASDIPW